MRRENQIDAAERTIAWIDKYLNGVRDPLGLFAPREIGGRTRDRRGRSRGMLSSGLASG